MSYIHQVLSDSPDLFYLLDESAGSADDLVGTNNGTYNGVTRAAVMGPFRRPAAQWPTQTQVVSFTKVSNPTGTLTDWSGGAWIRCTSTDSTVGYAGNPALSVLGDHTTAIWHSFGVHGGKVRFYRYNNAGNAWQNLESVARVNDDKWHYIAFTAKGTAEVDNVKLFIDGALDTQGQLAVSLHAATIMGFDSIGASYVNGTSYGDGFLGYIAGPWFKRALLTADRIKSHYEAGIRSGVSY